MIDQPTIDRILDAAQIVDVVSEFVTLRRRGTSFVGLCPFHDDKTPSFYVSPAKGLCKCFACGKGGNVVHFVMEHEQMTYPEALRWLAKKYHIEIKERELTDHEKQQQNLRESLFVVNDFAREYFETTLREHPDGRAIGMAYFRQRGVRDDIVKKFHLGYSTVARDAMAQEALHRGFKKDFLVKTGLCYAKDDGSLRDRFWGRVIFPWYNISGKVVGFGGRVLDSRTKGVQQKYVNSPESEIFSKRRELYGIYQAKSAIVKQDCVYMVEGYTDVIAMHQCGLENVVANSGTALSEQQIRLLHRFTSNIILLYDGDAAGIKASIRGIDMLLAEGMHIKVLLLPDGDDPDSFARKHTAEEFRAYIEEHAEDFIRFKTSLLLKDTRRDPIKRAALISDMARSIGLIPDNVVRYACLRECATLLNVNEQIIQNEIKKYLTQRDDNYLLQLRNEANRVEAPFIPQEDAQKTETPAATPSDAPKAEPEADEPPFPPEGMQDAPASADSPSAATSDATAQATASPAQTARYQSYIPEDSREQYLFYIKELALIKTLIRYGERVVCNVEDEEGSEVPLTVVEYIQLDLEQDNLQFHNPLHRRILSEALEHLHDEGFTAERYFVYHADPDISKLAANLSSDRYQLSKYHSKTQKIVTDEERLSELVPHQMIDFKLAILEEEMKQTLQQLHQPEVAADTDRCLEIMSHYKELSELLKELAKRAGDRVILKA
jgi:DNA primase